MKNYYFYISDGIVSSKQPKFPLTRVEVSATNIDANITLGELARLLQRNIMEVNSNNICMWHNIKGVNMFKNNGEDITIADATGINDDRIKKIFDDATNKDLNPIKKYTNGINSTDKNICGKNNLNKVNYKEDNYKNIVIFGKK